jgi:hypothetical protein
MKHKTSELEGAFLDAAVAMAERFPNMALVVGDGAPPFPRYQWRKRLGSGNPPRSIPSFSSDWAIGGPIIERERIIFDDPTWFDEGAGWFAHVAGRTRVTYGNGQTMLIAAMRAYVDSKFGDEVELP